MKSNFLTLDTTAIQSLINNKVATISVHRNDIYKKGTTYLTLINGRYRKILILGSGINKLDKLSRHVNLELLKD